MWEVFEKESINNQDQRMTNDEKIYLRVLNDLPFMLGVLTCADNETGSFTCSMLSERILQERNSFRLEEDNKIREAEQRIAETINKDIE